MMIKRMIILFVFIFAVNTAVMANIINVPDNQSTIQEGINTAVNGDTVLAAPGRYYENINFNGKNIVVASHYILNNDPSFINSTIIDGSDPLHSDTASCVLIVSGENTSAILEGFTLTGGNGTIWLDTHLNQSYREGGGILIELSSPTIKHNFIIGNNATNRSGVVSAGGGGVRCGDGNPLIISNIIKGNKGRYGAGIVMNFSTGVIKNNIIVENSGGEDYGGSGIWSYASGVTIIENNTIVGNSSSGSGQYGAGQGGGMLIWSTSITGCNNIVWDNTQSSGGQISLLGGASANITYSDIKGGWSGAGNINQDPMFADGNYILSDTSVCVDGGNPDSIYYDPEDSLNSGFAQYPSKGELRNDMGAYGGPSSSILPGIVTSINTKNDLIVPKDNILYQNHPNPFNPVTTISYEIPKKSKVILKVYDILGREVAELVNDLKEAGRYNIQFNGGNLASGVYLFMIKAGEFVAQKKMLLMK
jgi:hypothetical protein